MLSSPATCLPPFEEALEEFIRNRQPKVPGMAGCPCRLRELSEELRCSKGSGQAPCIAAAVTLTRGNGSQAADPTGVLCSHHTRGMPSA